jgi:hypothetical protein
MALLAISVSGFSLAFFVDVGVAAAVLVAAVLSALLSVAKLLVVDVAALFVGVFGTPAGKDRSPVGIGSIRT